MSRAAVAPGPCHPHRIPQWTTKPGVSIDARPAPEPAGGSKRVAGAEIDALRPKRRVVERGCRPHRTGEYAAGGNSGAAAKVERRVDLIAGSNDIADKDQIVAGKDAKSERQAVAELRLHLRHHGELIAACWPIFVASANRPPGKTAPPAGNTPPNPLVMDDPLTPTVS